MKTIPIAFAENLVADYCCRHPIERRSPFGAVLRDDFRPENGMDDSAGSNLPIPLIVELRHNARNIGSPPLWHNVSRSRELFSAGAAIVRQTFYSANCRPLDVD